MTAPQGSRWVNRAQRYILTGILTLIPLMITWFVFTFIFRQLSSFGLPWVQALANGIQYLSPDVAEFLRQSWFRSLLAVLLTLFALYFLGWIATLVIGKKLLNLFDALMHKIPLVQTIYGGTKKLLSSLQTNPGEVQRVVLIDFPHTEMKTVGLVTRILTDKDTGRQLAAVYVPTTPNPTSGYLEIVPVERLISTDWTMDQAMTFIISGGTVAPGEINFSSSAGKGA